MVARRPVIKLRIARADDNPNRLDSRGDRLLDELGEDRSRVSLTVHDGLQGELPLIASGGSDQGLRNRQQNNVITAAFVLTRKTHRIRHAHGSRESPRDRCRISLPPGFCAP